MKNRFLPLLRQDMVLSWRNGLILVTLVTMAIIVALYWTLPLMVSSDHEGPNPVAVYDASTAGLVSEHLAGEGNRGLFLPLGSEQQLEEYVEQTMGSGIIVQDSGSPGGGVEFILVFSSPPSGSAEARVQALAEDLYHSLGDSDRFKDLGHEILRPGSRPINLSGRLILVTLALEAMILGFLFVAVSVFQEKQEGSIRAYRVSPGGLISYVAAKVLTFSLISTLYGLLMVLFTRGPAVNWIGLAAVLLASCLFMTTLGLGVAVHFKNLSEWFAPGVVLLSVNMLSILPYQLPGYANPFITILPGYQMISAMSGILYPEGNIWAPGETFLYLAAYLAVALAFAVPAVRRNMLKEGK